MIRNLLIGVAALVMVLGAFRCFSGGKNSDGSEQAQRIEKVKRAPLRLTVAATGEVVPLRQVELKSKASGQVVRFTKREGEAVKVGELIVELDPRTEERNLRRAESDRNTAEAQLLITRLEYTRTLAHAQAAFESAKAEAESKQREFERLQGINDSVPAQELETARLNARVASERLKQAEADLNLARDRKEADEKLGEARLVQATVAWEEAQDRLRETKILSPIAGILLKKTVEEGQIVSSGISAASGGTALGIVADISVMVVEANVDETDIGKVKEAQEVELSVDAYPDRKFQGQVDLIPPLGELDSSIRVYKVKIAVRGPNLEFLKTGMTANVSIIIEDHPDVLQVASEAVQRDAEGLFVWLPKGTERTRLGIRIGLDNGTHAQVLEGLSEGQEVVVVYASRQSPGSSGGGGGRRR